VTDIRTIFDRACSATRVAAYWTARTARLMVGVPEYQTYVDRQRISHPGKPIMTYEEFFKERQNVRYAIEKGRFKGCC
jgi:uncharacterized short protein YbdD (DUF466 family)